MAVVCCVCSRCVCSLVYGSLTDSCYQGLDVLPGCGGEWYVGFVSLLNDQVAGDSRIDLVQGNQQVADWPNVVAMCVLPFQAKPSSGTFPV